MTLKRLSRFAILFISILGSTAFAIGPVMIERTHTIEEARISVKASSNTEGTVTATLLICDGCTPTNYSFDDTTVLINALGQARPIEELETWSGNRAMFRFIKANQHIEQIRILP